MRINPWRQTYAFVPHWAVLALLTIGTLPLWLRVKGAIRARRRAAADRCVTCGYDLRATPGICPECGTGGAS